MQRARRLASVAVAATLAVAGLSACRSEPSVAAYIGDRGRITEDRVQEVWDDARAAVDAAPAAQPDGAPAAPMPITRADVVRTLVGLDVLREVAKQKNVTVPADLPLQEFAQALRLPQDAEYVRLFAESDTLLKLLRQDTSDAPAPTEADLRQIYDVLVENGQVPAGTAFNEFVSALPAQNKQLVQSATAVRNQITKVAGPMRIKVNPRYQPLGISVLEFQTAKGELRPLVVAPLGGRTEADDPVTDLP